MVIKYSSSYSMDESIGSLFKYGGILTRGEAESHRILIPVED